ncbi:MAG TPA: PQQ-dependent sugar dehydrogenase [Ktedonobacterales bacterium]|nr:PQQ-dependent sugar dehydrogenase [Ktedonobacterales bacterium]
MQASTSVPAGFTKRQLASGLNNPTALAFAPNGDIYIAEQSGSILIYRNGAILPTPVVTLNTDGSGEKGLLGLALDPNFATNGYLYVSYTTSDEHAQLSRLTVTNGVASLASEVVYFKGNQAQNPHHSANDLHIGPDGKLWWSVGDNVPSISNAQTLTNIYGKILRFNLDGTIPSDNPFLHVPGAVPAIYAYGLRNPFRFTFLPNGKAMTEDTGSNYWEEMDTIQPGGNYGWDFYEGNCFSCGSINPVYAYGHVPTDGAMSAIAAYSGSTFPQQYDHVVFVGDYNRMDIEAVAFDPTYQTEISDTIFDSSAGTIADLQEGPDGNLYYVSIYEGTFTEIYPTGPFPPTAVASASPNAGLAPLTVQFSSAGSSDPYGLPLTYSWNFGDGSPVSTAANPSHIYTANGTYTATLTVSNGTQSGIASTQVVVGHTPPTAAITAPASGATYNGGDTISFSGTATDTTDGTLSASAYTWQADFYSNGVAQPFYTDEAPHPFFGPVTGVRSGSFQIPGDLSNTPSTFYRITLTVTDSLGLSTVVTRDIHPNLTQWSVNTNVPGAAYVVDGTWQTSTYTTQDVVGVQHVLTGVPTQTIGSSRYRFAGWSDGSALTDTFTNPATSATYTANYDQVSSTLPTPWQSVDVGSPLMAGTADYSASDQTFYVDGAGADVYGANEQFHYVYQTLNGDGTIIARVRYQTNSSPWAKAGVMIAASTTGSPAFVDALVTPTVSPNTPNVNGVGCTAGGCSSPLPPITPAVGHGVHMQYTPKGDKAVTSTSALAGFQSPNEWLKLQRSGNTFTSWYSTNGSTWTLIGTTSMTMGTSATIGLFVTSHNVGQYSTAAFDQVQVTGGGTPPPPVQLSNLVVADSANAAKWALQTNLQTGVVQYGDRGYTLTTVPATLVGAAWIRAANSSKTYTGSPLVTFTISRQATVYVALDTRLAKPPWLDATWSSSGLTLTNSEATGANSFVLYAKVFAAGTVTLGPNSSSGTSAVNMYTVIVQ